jgi:RNA polymerase sigma factor (sigma-70 family)
VNGSIAKLLAGLPAGKMSLEEETDLADTARAYATGQRRRAALETLVLSNLRDAFFYARRCCRGSMPDDDIYSACYSALCRSAVNFKPRWKRYFAFSKPYIRGSISRAWRKRDVVKNASEHESEDDTVLHHPPVEDPAVDPEFNAIHIREVWNIVEPLLKNLSKQEREVLRLHYNKGLNFVEIARLYRLSRERIRQIEARALRTLRTRLWSRKELWNPR